MKQAPHTKATFPLPAFRKSPHMKLLIILLIELRTWEHLTNHNRGSMYQQQERLINITALLLRGGK